MTASGGFPLHLINLMCLGSWLCSKYQHSVYALLRAVYPHHAWLPWHFKSRPKHWAKDQEMRRKFLDYMSSKLRVATYSELNRFPWSVFERHGASDGLAVPGGKVEDALLDSNALPPETSFQNALSKHLSQLLKSLGILLLDAKCIPSAHCCCRGDCGVPPGPLQTCGF